MPIERFPKRRLYPILGFFLALAAPAGLLTMRASLYGQLGSRSWLLDELAGRSLTYGYIAVSTAIVFVGLGYILGANEDLLHRVSLTDALTGLPNRRHFEKKLREELARFDRYREPLALMFIDLDRLKEINDRRGHEVGDNALKAVARTLQSTCRATDLAARFGGDEFAVLAPNTSEETSVTLAERIRRRLKTEASWVAVELPSLSVSIGVAGTRSIDDLRPDKLYSAADRALYRAKTEGRDRVVLAPSLEGGDGEDEEPEAKEA